MDSAAFAALCPGAAAVLLEAPGSLTMEVPDMPALIGAAKAQGLAVLVDNTWASPLGFAPLAHGADISIMSLTKHVSGHSDVVMGSTTAAAEWYGKLRLRSQNLGLVVSPDDAAIMLRGLRTMGLGSKPPPPPRCRGAVARHPARSGARAVSDAARLARP
jgi:cystathionine beta-lyase